MKEKLLERIEINLDLIFSVLVYFVSNFQTSSRTPISYYTCLSPSAASLVQALLVQVFHYAPKAFFCCPIFSSKFRFRLQGWLVVLSGAAQDFFLDFQIVLVLGKSHGRYRCCRVGGGLFLRRRKDNLRMLRWLKDAPQIPQNYRIVHVPECPLSEASFWNRSRSLVLGPFLNVGSSLHHGLLPLCPSPLLLVDKTVVVGAAADAKLTRAVCFVYCLEQLVDRDENDFATTNKYCWAAFGVISNIPLCLRRFPFLRTIKQSFYTPFRAARKHVRHLSFVELAAALVATLHEGDDGSPSSVSLSSFVGTSTWSSLRFFRGDGIVTRFCDVFGL